MLKLEEEIQIRSLDKKDLNVEDKKILEALLKVIFLIVYEFF